MSRPDVLTVDDLNRLTTVTVKQLASILGNVSTDTLYEMIARDEAPWKVLRLGKRILISASSVSESLGLGHEVDGAGCSGCRE